MLMMPTSCPFSTTGVPEIRLSRIRFLTSRMRVPGSTVIMRRIITSLILSS